MERTNMAKQDDSAFWTIFAYLVSGLAFWGGMGAVADHFLHQHFLIFIGLAVGLAAGLSLIWLRFIRQ
jgi:ATP synthase protein I